MIDLTHEIPPYDVRAGSLTLGRAAQYLCPGVVLAVVDPGVGTERRAIAVEVGGGQSYLVGPDNGLLASAVAMSGGATAAVELTNPDYQLVGPGPDLRRARRVRARRPPTSAPACRWPTWARPIDPLSLAARPAARSAARRTATWWPRSCGSTATATASSTSTPTRSPPSGPACSCAGATTSAPPTAPPPTRASSPGQVGLVVDSYGMLSVCLGKRSAADELAAARRHRGHPLRPRRRRPPDRRSSPGHHDHEGRPMRPGTTLVLALLLAMILFAAAAQLFFMR